MLFWLKFKKIVIFIQNNDLKLQSYKKKIFFYFHITYSLTNLKYTFLCCSNTRNTSAAVLHLLILILSV